MCTKTELTKTWILTYAAAVCFCAFSCGRLSSVNVADVMCGCICSCVIVAVLVAVVMELYKYLWERSYTSNYDIESVPVAVV